MCRNPRYPAYGHPAFGHGFRTVPARRVDPPRPGVRKRSITDTALPLPPHAQVTGPQRPPVQPAARPDPSKQHPRQARHTLEARSMFRPTRPQPLVATLSIAVLVFLVGCSPSSTPTPDAIRSGSVNLSPGSPLQSVTPNPERSSQPTSVSLPTVPHPSPTSGPRQSLVLPTSDWSTRLPSMDALLIGKLVLDQDNCVRIQPSGVTVSRSVYPLWPDGYTIKQEGANR